MNLPPLVLLLLTALAVESVPPSGPPPEQNVEECGELRHYNELTEKCECDVEVSGICTSCRGETLFAGPDPYSYYRSTGGCPVPGETKCEEGGTFGGSHAGLSVCGCLGNVWSVFLHFGAGEPDTWDDADLHCKMEGGQLFSFSSDTSLNTFLNFMSAFAAGLGGDFEAWLDGTCDRTGKNCRWQTSNETFDPTSYYTSCIEGFSEVAGECVALSYNTVSGFKLRTANCNEKKYPLCLLPEMLPTDA